MNAGDIMTTRVISVLPETSVREVARILHANRVSAVPVVAEDGRLLGMLSAGDLLRRAQHGPDGGGSWWLALLASGEPLPGGYAVRHDLTAREVMTQEVIRVREDAPLDEVAGLLERNRIKRVPVERDGKVVGIVSRANLAHGLASQSGGNAPLPGDAAIRAAILDTLERASVSTHLMNVVVTDGTAWLWGAVDSASEHAAVIAAARAAPGVKRVSDHLFLLASRLRPAPRD